MIPHLPMLRAFPAILFLLFCSLLANSQDITVKGVVRDPEGKPVAGASIIVKGTTKGSNSAVDGAFTVVSPPDATLEISSVGFRTQTVPVKGRILINIELEEARSQLSDIVVVGYGTQKKSDITGAISSIRNKDFKDQPVSNLAASLQGKLAGININVLCY